MQIACIYTFSTVALFVLPGLHVNSSILVFVMYKIYKDGCHAS